MLEFYRTPAGRELIDLVLHRIMVALERIADQLEIMNSTK